MINEYEIKGTDYKPAEILSNDQVISTLNGLIETCKDGQQGFQHAAEGISDPQLKTAFYQFSQQRSQFIGELQTAVRELGGDPENSGSLLGSLHRGWIDIKSAVTGRDEASILSEAERGEDIAKETYKAAMEKSLPANIRAVIVSQYNAVKDTHDRVRVMRDYANNARKSAKQNI
jgi:uncharacterized protein (TIGR02284 family)